ncbi:uncharacterized protein [Ciconia boyciana]|uniref:uncharacterized protein n=1 Tax=Ciconia boyciana TaxID=52775 RepID=UPI003BA3171A
MSEALLKGPGHHFGYWSKLQEEAAFYILRSKGEPRGLDAEGFEEKIAARRSNQQQQHCVCLRCFTINYCSWFTRNKEHPLPTSPAPGPETCLFPAAGQAEPRCSGGLLRGGGGGCVLRQSDAGGVPSAAGLSPAARRGFHPALRPDEKPSQKSSSALGLAFGKGEGQPRSSGESRAGSCAAAPGELAPAARPRAALPGEGRAPRPRTPCSAASHRAGGSSARPVIAANLPPRGPSAAPAGLAPGDDPAARSPRPPRPRRAAGRQRRVSSFGPFPRQEKKKHRNNLKHESSFTGDTTTWQQRSARHTLSGPFVGHSWNLTVNPCTSSAALTHCCISGKVRGEVEFTERKQGKNKSTRGNLSLPSLTPSVTQTVRL